ncbi:MAG TPA: class I adenylate-forming enzyme family protein [Xanthobacteraceae bacterium]|nr:class I adenylate-forming enzyme family protein [Xanthobacteraceae bacterium]
MILEDPRGAPATSRIGGRATLDGMLRQAAKRRPAEIALVDPPNRESFTDGRPRTLTWAQADRVVSAIAGRLRRMGLNTDAIVGIQVANTVESVLTLLGVLRAGLIAMPLPMLWHRADAVAALSRVSASALIVSGRIGAVDHCELAMRAAAEVFPVRHVCGFGGNLPDGFIPLDDLFSADTLDPIPSLEDERAAAPGPAAHLAVITWDVYAQGLVPVARSHAELIAGGLAVVLESRLEQNTVLLSTLALSSFAALATTVVPWLALGGTLALHQPFDADVFLAQIDMMAFDTVVVPGPLAIQLAEAGRLMTSDVNIVGIWRAPERLARAPAWPTAKARMIDVPVFGEAGLFAARRDADGKPQVIPFGVVSAPREPKGTVVALEIMATASRTLALRGPMVPRAPFPPEAERVGLPHFKVAPSGFVDTGYACRPNSPTMVLTAPPQGLVSIGGYRFIVRDLHDFVDRVEDGGGTLAVLPDVLAGHRLAGIAADHDMLEAGLAKLGANPLLVGAFRKRRRSAA